MTASKQTLLFTPTSSYTVPTACRAWLLRSFNTQVQISSAYSLPHAYPGYGYQEGFKLAFSSPHFHASLLCQIRSLFRIIGSLGSTSGGIFLGESTTALFGDIVSHRVLTTFVRKCSVRPQALLYKDCELLR